MSESTSNVEEFWKFEAEGVINDIKPHVKSIQIAEVMNISDNVIFLNIRTLENNKMCLELSDLGFRIVGRDFNDTSESSKTYFETPYALLDTVSPLYRDSFGEALRDKLHALQTTNGHKEI